MDEKLLLIGLSLSLRLEVLKSAICVYVCSFKHGPGPLPGLARLPACTPVPWSTETTAIPPRPGWPWYSMPHMPSLYSFQLPLANQSCLDMQTAQETFLNKVMLSVPGEVEVAILSN